MSFGEKMKKDRILSFGSAFVYGLGIFGLQFFIGYINTYQSQFYTSVFGANLMVVAVIILTAKLISALADPFIGNLVDRCDFKSGKMRPFVLFSAFPIAILTTVMFVAIPFKTKGGMYAYITFTTVLWNIAMSFADIPSQGMLAVLSPRAEERNAAAGITNILRSIALGAPSVVVPVICILTKSPGGAITKKEYLLTALFVLVVGLTLYLLIYFCNRETVPSQSNRLSLKDMFGELKNNKMLLIVFLTFMLGFGRNMAMGIGVQAAAVLLKNGIDVSIGSFHYRAAGENLPWLIGLTGGIGGMVSIFASPFINQKWGEKKTFIVFAVYGVVVCVLSFVLYVLGIPALRTLWAILVYNFFVSFMCGPNGYLPMVMVSDIVDYREWQTGKRTEGTQFAVLSLSNKISNALSVACGIFVVGASGYFGGISPSAITDRMQNIVFSALILIPGVCNFLAAIPVFFYKIDGKTKKIVQKALAERRAAISEE